MRSVRLCMLILLAGTVLFGCTNKPSTCFPGQKCGEYQVYTRCGSYLRYECEDICRTCNAYEQSCYACWTCIDTSPEACVTSRSVAAAGNRCGIN